MKPKRFLSMLLLTAMMLVLFQIPAAAEEATEPPAAWAAAQMADLDDAGILGAKPNAHPSRPITRGYFVGRMVDLLQREGQLSLLSAVPPVAEDYFVDIVSTGGYRGRGSSYDAAAYGLTAGSIENGQRKFNYDKNLTREEGATMICSLLNAVERYVGPVRTQAGEPRTFVDAASISAWAVESVNRASSLGILSGDDTGRFNPKRTLSVQEAYVMLDKVFLLAEEARIARDLELGIRSFKTSTDLPADECLSGLIGQSSYLLERNGAFSILQIRDNRSSAASGIWLETFDASGNSTSVREIPMELEYCAAFYEGSDAYYLLFGQKNEEKNDGKEVCRVVRYDKNWNRQRAVSLFGKEIDTAIPCYFTDHSAMTEENGQLIVHTARQMYGGHQANLTIKISVPEMKLLDFNSNYSPNYVSHSFAQYVMFDKGLPVYADHGDAYPRGFTLNVEDSSGESMEMNFFPFAGRIGDNNTHAYPGGLGISDNFYLFAGSSSAQKGDDKNTRCNTFLAIVPKAGYPNSTPTIKWLTNFPADDKEYVPMVQLVQMNRNTFVVMWQSQKVGPRTVLGDVGTFCYAVFDGQGNQIGQTVTKENYAAPKNDPLVIGNRILWTRTEMGPYGVFGNSRSRYMKLYELEIPLN